MIPEPEVYDFEIRPFIRIIVEAGYNKLRDELCVLARECWLAELKSVAEGMRACATMHISSETLFRDLKLLEELGLVFVPIRECARVNGFAHKFYAREPGKPYDVYGVVARDYETGRKFAKADRSGDHITVGKLLGYPECCVKFFIHMWPKWYDPIWPAALNTPGAKVSGREVIVNDCFPEANILLRYCGIRAVPHLVCNFKCKATKEFAEEFMQFIPHRRELINLLSQPITWDAYKGVVMVRMPHFIVVANTMPLRHRHIVKLSLLRSEG